MILSSSEHFGGFYASPSGQEYNRMLGEAKKIEHRRNERMFQRMQREIGDRIKLALEDQLAGDNIKLLRLDKVEEKIDDFTADILIAHTDTEWKI